MKNNMSKQHTNETKIDLLATARKYSMTTKQNHPLFEEEVKASLEWVAGKITNKQLEAALKEVGGMKAPCAPYRMGIALREAFSRGLISIE